MGSIFWAKCLSLNGAVSADERLPLYLSSSDKTLQLEILKVCAFNLELKLASVDIPCTKSGSPR